MTAVKFITLAVLAVLLNTQDQSNLVVRVCSILALMLMLWEAYDLTR